MSGARRSLSVRNAHVVYEVFGDRRAGLRRRFAERNATGRSSVYAVRGVDLEAVEGEAIGIVGFNGSGKSTLLAAIAGVLPLTEGEILASDHPKLMGVGASLIPLASGYRNIRLGCLALGLSADEVDGRIDELVDFTELGDAIHRPLNTYSSGMKARVHFVIATAIQPRILLIDEALAVGDRRFRAKSRAKIEGMLAEAGTLLMVNHSLSELETFCERGIWLDEGAVRLDAPIGEVVAAYSDSG